MGHVWAVRGARCALLGGLLLLATAAADASDLRVVDLEGRRIDPLDSPPSIRTIVFIFTTTDCPIANRYAPEIVRLFETFSKRGVRFWLVYVNPAESVDDIRTHAAKFKYTLPIARDMGHELVKRLGVTVTPESVVVDRHSNTLYRGRIDDRYVDFGVERPAPTRHDLADTLTAVVSGRRVAAPITRAVGCIIADFRPITFAKDIAPLIFDRCASCHRPKGPAPFSLLTYADVRQRASQIAAVIERRFMPPWKAASGAGEFVGQKPLGDGEIGLIRQWVNEGSIEGDGRELSPAPRFSEGWQLGTPDLVATIPKAFTLKADGTDVFRIFVIPLPIDSTRYVRGLEFQPGNARVVHHANLRLDHTIASRDLDARDPAPGYDGLMARSAVYPDGHFLGWTPGQIAPLVPSNMAWRLDPGTDLVVQLHMQPSGTVEDVQPSIGLYFGNEPPTRTPTILRLGSQGIDIAPGEARYIVTDSYVLPVDVELQAVQPHAHYRLRIAEGVATLPDGSSKMLIEIEDWDFRWQHVYRYTAPVPLPKGTRVAMRYEYDNSADNPRNPQHPPRRVFWGQRSFDEMGDLWFQFTTGSDHDRMALNTEIQKKMTAEDIVGYETMLGANPQDAELHDDAALLYLSVGSALDAVRHFRASAQLRPGVAAAHFNLGTALSVAGRLDEAVRAYRQALALSPDYARAHNNLGMVLATQGRGGQALEHLREAVRLDSANAQAQRNLAWHIATAAATTISAASEAVAAGERAATLTDHRDAHVLDALAAAYAAAGMFERARATAERAIVLTRDESLRRAMQERLELYHQRRPYRAR